MHMPKQRRLNPENKQQAAEMLHLKANKKMLQNHLIHMTGKPVILKDLHNLYTQSKPKSKCDFQELVDAMKGVKGKELHIPLLYTALLCCLFRCSYNNVYR